MELVLLVVQIIVALLLIGSVLLQRSESDGMGLGGSGGGGLLSSRGQANLMTRTTAILALIFMCNSLLLSVLNAQSGASSLVDQIVAEQPQTLQAPKDGMEIQKTPLPDSAQGTKQNPAVVPAQPAVPEKTDMEPASDIKTPVAPKAE